MAIITLLKINTSDLDLYGW